VFFPSFFLCSLVSRSFCARGSAHAVARSASRGAACSCARARRGGGARSGRRQLQAAVATQRSRAAVLQRTQAKQLVGPKQRKIEVAPGGGSAGYTDGERCIARTSGRLGMCEQTLTFPFYNRNMILVNPKYGNYGPTQVVK